MGVRRPYTRRYLRGRDIAAAIASSGEVSAQDTTATRSTSRISNVTISAGPLLAPLAPGRQKVQFSADIGANIGAKQQGGSEESREGSREEKEGVKDGVIKRSRSKSLGNEHERLITASYDGYRDAETRIKKKAQGSYGSGGRGGGVAKSMATYVLSKYGRNEQDAEEEEEGPILVRI